MILSIFDYINLKQSIMSRNSLQKIELSLLSLTFCALLTISCKSDQVEPEKLSPTSIQSVSYQWGELSINRKNVNDIIKYDEKGKMAALLTTDDKNISTTIDFDYQGNKIFLNTASNDSYELDDKGRVVLHTSSQVQHGMTFVNTEKYSYDNAGYLVKIDLASNNLIYSVVTYDVNNGNYQKFSLSNPKDGKVTRQYVFSYNNTKVASSFSMFTAIFANNTYSAIEKYLNFGKQSANQLSSVDYSIMNLNGDLKRGTFNVVSHLDGAHNIIKFELIGNEIGGMPSDNLSPLPRTVSLKLNQK